MESKSTPRTADRINIAPVFATVDGKITSPSSISKAWERATRRLDRKASFHATRHHHASRLIADGVDVVTATRRLGHGSPAITLKIYAHLMGSDDRIAKVMLRALTEAAKRVTKLVDMIQQLLKKKRQGLRYRLGANFRFRSSSWFAK